MTCTLQFTRREVIVTLAGLVWTNACGRRNGVQPVLVTYGRDECAWCRMTVDDPTLAAEWISSDASPQVFGEPGCLAAWLAAHPGATGTAWVRTRDRDEWRRATEAVFLPGAVQTPMSFNLAAFAAAPSGTTATLTWEELLQKGMPDARPS